MSTVTFDTHQVVSKLRSAGFDEKQAEAVVQALTQSTSDLVTKDYLRAELAPIKWVLGAVFAGILSLVLKAYF